MSIRLHARPSWLSTLSARRPAVAARRKAGQLQRERGDDARFRPMFDLHPQPMWVHDEDTLRFLAVNDAMVARYGWSREELSVMTVEDLTAVGEYADGVDFSGRKAICHRTKHGELIEVDTHERAMAFDGRNGHMVLAIDVTERRRMIRALWDSEERHRTIVETAQEGIVVHDNDGRVQLMNERMGAILGVEPDEQVGRHVADVFATDPAEGRGEVPALTPSAVEFKIVLEDGAERWLLGSSSPWYDSDGDPRGVVLMCADVTERVERESRLECRARQQAAIADLGAFALQANTLQRTFESAVDVIATTLDTEFAFAMTFHGGGDLHGEAMRGWQSFPVKPSDHDPEFLASLGRGAVSVRPADDAPENILRQLRSHGIEAGILAGIVVDGEVRGAVASHSRDSDAFGSDERYFMQSIANVVGSALARHEAEERTRELALHDALTGLPNRAVFEDRLVEWGSRATVPGAVMFVDVDHFKVLNDALGHEAGDELLRALAPRFEQALGERTLVARFGGDEFVILAEGIEDEEVAKLLGLRLLETLTAPVEIQGRPHHVSVSVGVKLVRPGADDLQSAVREADSAMYLAKERGRERVEVFDAQLHQRVVDRLRVDRDLRHAMTGGDELWCAYQPLVDAATRKIVGIEALARWRHPELGELSPAEFIPAAEELGLIGALGWHVLDRAVRDTAAWVAEGGELADAANVSVNLSPQQLADPSLAPRIAVLLDDAGLSPRRLTLEVTETTLMTDTAAAQRGLEELAALGIRLVLDDFGTGFSSMAYLSKMPVSGLKIDRSFIQELGESSSTEAIVKAIVSMAAALDLDVVAEGVETEVQALAARALGSDKLQGFYFARPLPAEEIAELVVQVPSAGSVAA